MDWFTQDERFFVCLKASFLGHALSSAPKRISRYAHEAVYKH